MTQNLTDALIDTKALMYTKAVSGKGDYNAGLKAVAQAAEILTKAGKGKLRWIVETQQEDIIQAIEKLKATNQFPNVEIVHIKPPQSLVTPVRELLAHTPKDTELIIVFPNINPMEVMQDEFIRHCPSAKILNISEYDYDAHTSKPRYLMGFGLNSLGVLIPEVKASASAQLPEEKSLDALQLNQNFFFGYANYDVTQQISKEAVSAFIKSAVVLAEKEGHNPVQIVLNLPPHILKLHQSFLQEQGFTDIEYHSQSNKDTTSLTSASSTGPKKTLKVFNPFPVSGAAFQYLLAHAHPVVLCTGDQSLVENVFGLKAVFYQVMNWKFDLGESFINFVKNSEVDPLYYDIVSTAINYPDELPDLLRARWNQNSREIIQRSAQKVQARIVQENNFNKLLPKLIHMYIGSKEERIAILKELIDVNTSILPTVLKDFPKEHPAMYQAMADKLPDCIQSMRDFFNLYGNPNLAPVSEEERGFKAKAKQSMLSKLPNIMENGYALANLLNFPNTQISVEERAQIWQALAPRFGNLFKNGPELLKLFSLSTVQLNTNQRNQIWQAVLPSLGTLFTHSQDLMQMFKLTNEQLSPEQRRQLWQAVIPKLKNLIHNSTDLSNLLKINGLTAEDNNLILQSGATRWGNWIKYSHDLVVWLSNKSLTSEHRSQILQEVTPHIETLLKSSADLSFLFTLSSKELSMEDRSKILKILSPKLDSMIHKESDLEYLFRLPKEKLNDEHRSIINDAVSKEKKLSYSRVYSHFKPSPDSQSTTPDNQLGKAPKK